MSYSFHDAKDNLAIVENGDGFFKLYGAEESQDVKLAY